MILRRNGLVDEGIVPPGPAGAPGAPGAPGALRSIQVGRADELERAKLALLQSGTRVTSGKRRPWIKRHPLAVGVGLFVAGVLIGRSPVLRGLLAATAVLAARTAAQRAAGRLVHKVRL